MGHGSERAADVPSRRRASSTRSNLARAREGAAFLLPLLLVGSLGGTPANATGDAQVDLGTARFFTILSESGITDVPASKVIGNVGTSPITGAADLLSCAEVHGQILSVDAAGPQPCSVMNPGVLTIAVNDMQQAYTGARDERRP